MLKKNYPEPETVQVQINKIIERLLALEKASAKKK